MWQNTASMVISWLTMLDFTHVLTKCPHPSVHTSISPDQNVHQTYHEIWNFYLARAFHDLWMYLLSRLFFQAYDLRVPTKWWRKCQNYWIQAPCDNRNSILCNNWNVQPRECHTSRSKSSTIFVSWYKAYKYPWPGKSTILRQTKTNRCDRGADLHKPLPPGNIWPMYTYIVIGLLYAWNSEI